jgi:hypothetical protein
VGSANLSQDSSKLLDEAGVLLTKPQEVQQVRRYLNSLIRRSVELDSRSLSLLARYEPQMKFHPPAWGRQGVALPSRVWITDAWPDEEESTRERQLKTSTSCPPCRRVRHRCPTN